MAVGALAAPAPAAAHGLVGRADLPIPEWLFGWAAAVVLIVSFAALALLWQEPQARGPTTASARSPRACRSRSINPATEVFAGLVGVGLLGLTVYAGLAGVQSPQANFAPTFIYVIFWVGLVPAQHPARRRLPGVQPVARDRARRRLARVPRRRPAAGALPLPRAGSAAGRRRSACSASPGSSLPTRTATTPARSRSRRSSTRAITLLAIACFGTEAWISRGEAFSVYFNLFSRISPVEVRDGRLGLRAPAVRAHAARRRCPGPSRCCVVMIGTVAFDGASEGKPWADIAPDIQDFFTSIGFSLGTALELTFTVGMLIGARARGDDLLARHRRGPDRRPARPFGEIARSYMHTLVPIAAAYVLAHYFSLLAYNGQAIAYLASDPLGEGSDLFGTADSTIDYGVISATAIWYVQVGVLVVGHVCGLVLAHDRALAMYEKARAATTSQYWMLAVMVAFTTGGLFLLSQANQ